MDLIKKQNTKNRYGQYFTPKVVADFMVDLADIHDVNLKILEPSCGEGVFLEVLQNRGYNNLTAYEIDENLAAKFPFVRYESFISANINEKFDLIIGNPPYIRWKNLEEELKRELLENPIWNKYFNSLCDYLYIFILKSIDLLNENGQLIFICPEYWMNTTHSASLRNYMLQEGYFKEIYHFNETPIFEKATVSTVVFRFVKGTNKSERIKVVKYHDSKKLTAEVLENLRQRVPVECAKYIEVPQFKTNERWLLQNETVVKEIQQLEYVCQKRNQPLCLNLFEQNTEFHKIEEVCDIGNGLVSGLDKAFQLNKHELNDAENLATINVVKAKDLKPYFAGDITRYIFVNKNIEEVEFQKTYPNFYMHFQRYKTNLKKRYQYNREINYWEWSFLRNFNLFSKKDKRIFVPSKERISNKDYFRFALVEADVFPTQDVTAIFKKDTTRESIEYILAYLNQQIVFDWLRCNGIVKGSIVEFSEKPIASIPFKKINWNNEIEASTHDQITDLTQKYLATKNKNLLSEINTLFSKLIGIKNDCRL